MKGFCAHPRCLALLPLPAVPQEGRRALRLCRARSLVGQCAEQSCPDKGPTAAALDGT